MLRGGRYRVGVVHARIQVSTVEQSITISSSPTHGYQYSQGPEPNSHKRETPYQHLAAPAPPHLLPLLLILQLPYPPTPFSGQPAAPHTPTTPQPQHYPHKQLPTNPLSASIACSGPIHPRGQSPDRQIGTAGHAGWYGARSA